jgi:glycosyltransferase involved in cell wall biosynthesis
LVDDGSKDKTREIILKNKETSNLPIFFYENTPSGGPSSPTNVGIRKAKGDFIAFLDHDDEWEEDKIEKTIELFDSRKDIDVVGSNIKIINDNIKKIEFFNHPSSEPSKKELTRIIAGDHFFTSFSHLVIRREVVEIVGFLDESLSLAADHDYWLRISLCCKVFLLPYPLTIYRLHKDNNSVVLRKVETVLKDSLTLLNKHKKIYKEFPSTYGTRLENIADLYALLGKKKESLIFIMKSIIAYPIKLRIFIKGLLILVSVNLYKKIKKI